MSEIILARRRFLFMAPAIIAAPSLMKLSALAQVVPIVPALVDEGKFRLAEHFRLLAEQREQRIGGALDYQRFRDIVEPILRQHFEEHYNIGMSALLDQRQPRAVTIVEPAPSRFVAGPNIGLPRS